MKPFCKNCKYWSGESLFGQCHRFPSMTDTPPTHWCGEFKSKTSGEKEPKPKVGKDDMDSVIRAYKNAFQARFGSVPSVNKVDYAAAKKMILEDGVDTTTKYINSFFWNMPKWNLDNKVFDLRIIPGLRNKLVLSSASSKGDSVDEFLANEGWEGRYSRLWPEYADYVKKTGKKISMKDWVREVNG